ncbi:MAG: sulfatase-like hydrolase/transferase, partial [Eubacterium sp.]
ENTIVVFTSDHGELFGAHGRRAKNIFYEEAIRVPFLIRRQGALEQGVKRDVVFNTVDIMPTLLSMMELPIPETVEGSDYSRCVTGEADNNEGALMMCTGPTATFGDGNEWRAYRTKQYTYAIFKSDGQELLFDNLADPFQMNNLAGNPEYATIQAKLKAAMWDKMNKISDTFENNTYYQENWVENRLIMRTATSEYCDYVSNS